MGEIRSYSENNGIIDADYLDKLSNHFTSIPDVQQSCPRKSGEVSRTMPGSA